MRDGFKCKKKVGNHLDALLLELVDALRGLLDDGGVVATAQTAVARDEDEGHLLHVTHFQDGQLQVLLLARVQHRLEDLSIEKKMGGGDETVNLGPAN